ncbi:hypothetical protein A1O3_02339 [Capronia epimyces CBS 606.96]|uniref:Kinetochore protein fta4 n=1 Tax=Capronia epimyces CBS 606.96 TaxID=1182542 RepID=W9Y9R6_9EURO|nr:uncharacterized protein A1O3_02339 [Capronia epimyces CBS 606.96]EXJ89273.1 hypothetical protein A1O3_02339 [Capronia epimyces CBS 606.96]
MDEHSQSITAVKAAFIRAQVRQLSAPLEASTTWRDLAPRAEVDGRLSDRAIQDVVAKVNDKIKQHNRMVFSQQSQRHVAEQIETLYWNRISTESQTDAADEPGPALEAVAIRKEMELTDTGAIGSLPEQYTHLHLDAGYEGNTADAEAYTRLRGQLLQLSRKRDELKEKVARYRYLQTLLEPLDDAQKNVQPNLITRDGELSRELDRMRILLARVTGRVAEIQKSSTMRTEVTDSSQPQIGQTDRQKLELLMDLT